MRELILSNDDEFAPCASSHTSSHSLCFATFCCFRGGGGGAISSDGNGDGDGDRVFGLKEMQGAGFEVGTVVEDLESVGEEEVVEGILKRARELLSRS
ncbi:hypothetical protein ScalyP_jg8254 [Parmales sp. scaly parma]|nr:hypothetical protein ScalyP_jg8254 [Parmales sp. scaly parma]